MQMVMDLTGKTHMKWGDEEIGKLCKKLIPVLLIHCNNLQCVLLAHFYDVIIQIGFFAHPISLWNPFTNVFEIGT